MLVKEKTTRTTYDLTWTWVQQTQTNECIQVAAGLGSCESEESVSSRFWCPICCHHCVIMHLHAYTPSKSRTCVFIVRTSDCLWKTGQFGCILYINVCAVYSTLLSRTVRLDNQILILNYSQYVSMSQCPK